MFKFYGNTNSEIHQYKTGIGMSSRTFVRVSIRRDMKCDFIIGYNLIDRQNYDIKIYVWPT